MLKNKRMYYANNRGKKRINAWAFNCWGATAFVLGLDDNLGWYNGDDMTKLLCEKTVEVSKRSIQRGDILVIYERPEYSVRYYLNHTAVYLGRERYFHKKGSDHSEITTLDNVFKIYGKSKVEYRRVV